MVFVHNNIREIVEEDPVFKTCKKVYVYDEVQYTYQEWYALTIKDMQNEIKNLKKYVYELASIISKQRNSFSTFLHFNNIGGVKMSISNGFPGIVKIATQSMSGLMSSSDKIKLDSINPGEIAQAKEDIDELKSTVIPTKIYTIRILRGKD